MAIFPFKVGDEVLVCSESRYYGRWNGYKGVVKELERDHYARIKKIHIDWTWTPKQPETKGKGSALSLQFHHLFAGVNEPPEHLTIATGAKCLRKADACHSCVHRVHHITGNSCADKKWIYSATVVKERLAELREQKE